MEKEANIIKLLVSFNNLQNSIIIEDKNYHIYVINSGKINTKIGKKWILMIG